MVDKETFGKVLTRQLLAIDFLSSDLANDFREKLLKKYVQELGISFFTLHFRETIDKRTALQTDRDFLVNGNPRPAHTIQLADGNARDQVSFVYMMKKPCWIVGASHKNLVTARVYVDLWDERNLEGIPKYQQNAKSKTKTTVIIPEDTTDDSEPDAIVNFEFEEFVQPTPYLKEELQLLADIAFTLRRRTLDTREERTSTMEAFDLINVEKESRRAGNAILAALLAADIINKDIFNYAKQKIEQRIKNLGADFYIFHKCLDVVIDEIPEPATIPSRTWNKGWQDNGTELLGNKNRVYSNGEYTSQVGYVFDRRITAVIRGDADTFSASTNFRDTENNDFAVPPYTKNTKFDTALSIICPSAAKGNQLFGIANFEFIQPPERLDDIFIQDLTDLSRSIGRLQYLFDISTSMDESSKQSIEDLAPFVDPRLRFKQKIFFAYPDECDEEVIDFLETALNDLSAENKLQVELMKWKDAVRVGSAHSNMRKEIAESQFVIGYLSEPSSEEGSNKYADNINVMIELSAAYFQEEEKALGIREEYTDKDIPFDLGDMQLVTIKRNKHGAKDQSFEREVVKLVADAMGLKHIPEAPKVVKDENPEEIKG